MEITKSLAKNIVETRYDDLSREVQEATKRSILDTLGVMLPPTTLDKACIALAEMIREAGGKGREYPHRVWRKGPLLDGCFCEWFSYSSPGL